MKNYINNLETGRIELHFEKSDYQGLSAEEKREIKSAFTWSRYANAWVSRSTKNHYSALRVAAKFGFTEEEKQGERLSFVEELERKAEKAERRADRYEYKAEKAEGRAESLQSDFNEARKDWSFVTQPIIAGHSGSQGFKNHRDKIMNRYNKGFEEYRKSEYYKDRAGTARATADQKQLQDPIYLANRIKECNSTIKKLEKNIVNYENKLYRIEQGEILKRYSGEILTAEQYQGWIDETLKKMEYEIDKLAYLENCMEEIGGNKFSKENIKVGYIVNIKRTGKVEVLSAGPKNIKYKILDGGAAGMVLIAPYAAITKIIEEKEVEKQVENTFKVGDIVTLESVSGNRIIEAYQIVKTTAKTVTIQKIKVENNEPIKDSFISEKQERRSIKEDRQGNPVLNNNDWWMYKYKVA